MPPVAGPPGGGPSPVMCVGLFVTLSVCAASWRPPGGGPSPVMFVGLFVTLSVCAASRRSSRRWSVSCDVCGFVCDTACLCRQSPVLQEVVRLSRALDTSEKELISLREAKARAEDETAEARLEVEQFTSRAADQRECPQDLIYRQSVAVCGSLIDFFSSVGRQKVTLSLCCLSLFASPGTRSCCCILASANTAKLCVFPLAFWIIYISHIESLGVTTLKPQ